MLYNSLIHVSMISPHNANMMLNSCSECSPSERAEWWGCCIRCSSVMMIMNIIALNGRWTLIKGLLLPFISSCKSTFISFNDFAVFTNSHSAPSEEHLRRSINATRHNIIDTDYRHQLNSRLVWHHWRAARNQTFDYNLLPLSRHVFTLIHLRSSLISFD